MNIPESHQDLLHDDNKAIAFLATLMKDGTPQVTPVWFNWDGQDILINTAQGRVKDRNMRRNPHVALAIADPRDAARYLQIRGTIVDITTEGALEHANKLSIKYDGHPWVETPGQVRVIYRIRPEHIQAG